MVSIDGQPWIHNRFRVLKDSGANTFEQAWNGLNVLSEMDCSVSVSAVYAAQSKVRDFCSFIDRLKALGVRELELTLVMQTKDAKAQNAHTSIKDLATNLVEIYRHACSVGMLLHGDWIDPFHRLLSTSKLRADSALKCPAGSGCSATSHQISLEPSGELFPCRAMATHYGNLDNLEQILQSDTYRNVVMRTYYNVPYCQNCTLEGFCQGTCLGSCEEANQNIYDPQEDYCAVYRECTKLLLMDLVARQHNYFDSTNIRKMYATN